VVLQEFDAPGPLGPVGIVAVEREGPRLRCHGDRMIDDAPPAAAVQPWVGDFDGDSLALVGTSRGR